MPIKNEKFTLSLFLQKKQLQLCTTLNIMAKTAHISETPMNKTLFTDLKHLCFFTEML
ncbi:hypothetical protein BARBAKC583_0524 [Bartonella bacilliformis KC583]|uniref:Uncharacterized protein n=1 Tax=Bartonella bacilliformis (strain ATCC 35685 / KC583 / Herrer 020/F12,63) TaxID=360095 RepID=A1US86_BARBK|nr:hypothetical protein BARBAKC583_0524 [Bartonella bacilliformis KC583]